MALEPKIEFDPATGKIVEFVSQELGDISFETDLDNAQNELNAAGEALSAATDAAAVADAAAEAAHVQLEAVQANADAKAEALAFQTSRKAAYDQAVGLRDSMANATPESEFASDVAADSADGSVDLTDRIAVVE